MWLWMTLTGCPYITDAQNAARMPSFRLSGAYEIDEAEILIGAPVGPYGFGSALAAEELGPADTDEGADAKADLIVGASGRFDAEPVPGAVVVLEVLARGTSVATPSFSSPWLTGEADDGAGWSVAAIGGDLVVGAPFSLGNHPDDAGPGAVYQIPYATLRAADGFAVDAKDAPGRVRGLLQTGAGFALATYDADNDGVDDLLASEPFAGVLGGSVVMFSAGLGERLDPNGDANVEGPLSLGTALADGDFDGDGIGDLVAGAAFAGDDNEGAAYVIPGPLRGDLSTDDALAEIAGPGAIRLGYEVDADDLDGDGLDDLVLAAPEGTQGDVATGALWWIRASDLASGDPAALAAGSVRGDEDGDACCTVSVGDVDLDGIGDVLVGAPGQNGSSGAAALFYGPLEGSATLGDAPFRVVGQNRSGATGYAVLLADVTDDEHLDVLIGAPFESLVGEDFAGAVGIFVGVGR